MKLLSTTTILAFLLGLSFCMLLASDAQADRSKTGRYSKNKDDFDINTNDIKTIDNLDDDDIDNRIIVSEPIKMVARVSYTTVLETLSERYSIFKYFKKEPALEWAYRLGNALTKKTILWPTIEVLAALVTAVSSIFFFFPSTFAYLETRYRFTAKALNLDSNFLNRTSFEPEAIIEQLSRSSDEIIDRWMINDKSCRERSICEIGDIVACYIPGTISSFKNFISSYLPDDFELSRSKYYKAFVKGLNHANCSEISSSFNAAACPSLHDWLGTYFWGNNPKRPNK